MPNVMNLSHMKNVLIVKSIIFRKRPAIAAEISSLNEMKASIILPQKKEKLFRMKKKSNSPIAKYKTALVIKSFNQRQDIVYSQTIHLARKLGTVRLLISTATSAKMHIMQFDVSTVFLNGDLDETIYRINLKALMISPIMCVNSREVCKHSNKHLDTDANVLEILC